VTKKFEYYDNDASGSHKEIRLHVYDKLCPENEREIKKGNYDLLWFLLDDYHEIENIISLNPKLRKLMLQSSKVVDVSWVSELTELELLFLTGKLKGKIDFNRLEKLKQCDLDFCKVTESIVYSKCKLDSLGFRNLSIPLTEFSPEFCKTIRVLGVIRGKISSLEGVEKFVNLKRLGLMDLRKLTDIRSIKNCKLLESLSLTSCNYIDELGVIGTIPSLKKLFYDSKIVSSLDKFLPGKSIEYIRLGERTLIEDRNVDVFMKFPLLKRVGYTKKKGYSCNGEQMNKLLENNKDTH
jgi:hypothetical protein